MSPEREGSFTMPTVLYVKIAQLGAHGPPVGPIARGSGPDHVADQVNVSKVKQMK